MYLTKKKTIEISGPALRALLFVAGLATCGSASAERISLSSLKSQLDALDSRVTDCEKGVDGACRKVANIVTVAHEGGDFTSIQAAIDSVPEPVDPATGEAKVVPTLIKIAHNSSAAPSSARRSSWLVLIVGSETIKWTRV